MLYLNGPEGDGPAFKGGATNFFSPDYDEEEDEQGTGPPIIKSVIPEAGMAIIFFQGPEHKLFHEGAKLTEGLKYILRTNVFYHREGTDGTQEEETSNNSDADLDFLNVW